MLVHCCFMFAFAGLDCFPLNNHSHKTNKQTNKEQKKKKQPWTCTNLEHLLQIAPPEIKRSWGYRLKKNQSIKGMQGHLCMLCCF